MRKITEQAVKKFLNMENFSNSNTKVYHTPGLVELLLHWNVIADYWINDWVIEIKDGWHQTDTTKERINWLLLKLWWGHVFQKQWIWYYQDEHWKVRPFGMWIARSILSTNKWNYNE